MPQSREEPAEEATPRSSAHLEQAIKPLSAIMETWAAYFTEHLKDTSPLLLRFAKKKLEARSDQSGTYILSLENELDVKLFEEIKVDVMEFLRKNHGVQELQITTLLLEEADRPRLPYTNSERFQAMLEESPALRIMTEKFGLDPDF